MTAKVVTSLLSRNCAEIIDANRGRLLTAQDCDEIYDISEVNIAILITIRLGLISSIGKNRNEWSYVKKIDDSV